MVDSAAIDSQRFVELLAEAGTAQPAAAVGLYDSALSLWRGSAFEEFADEEWVMATTVWLDEARVTAREDRIEALISGGIFGSAVGDAEKLAADFPLRERPGYWEQVDYGTATVGSSRAAYLTLDHDHMVGWFERHWDLLEPLIDDPDLGHIRFATFDGDQLRYRFRVIGLKLGTTVRLVEFAVVD